MGLWLPPKTSACSLWAVFCHDITKFKRKPYHAKQVIQKCGHLLGAKANLKWSAETYFVVRNLSLKLFLKTMLSLGLKRTSFFQFVINAYFKSLHFRW